MLPNMIRHTPHHDGNFAIPTPLPGQPLLLARDKRTRGLGSPQDSLPNGLGDVRLVGTEGAGDDAASVDDVLHAGG